MRAHKNNRKFLRERFWVGAALVTASLSWHCQSSVNPGQDMAPSDMAPSDMAATGGGLRIVSFGTNVTQLTQGQSVKFVAALTDPSGLQNVMGGELVSPDGNINYGPFVAAQPGDYSLTLSWDQINQAQELNFATTIQRTFVAKFYDSAGAPTTKSVQLSFYCSNNQVSYKGICSDGCYFNNSYWAAGSTNPANACQQCRPATQISAWSNLSDGASCGTSLACKSGSCVAQFSDQSSGWGVDLNGVWGSASNDVYAVGESGFILHTANGGATWTALRSSINTWDLLSIWGSASNDVYTVGTKGIIFHSVDGGATWANPSSGTSNYLAQVWGSGSDDVYVVGGSGTILHSTNGGATWTPQSSGTSRALTSIWGSGRNDVYIVGEYGLILHSTNSGATWTSKTVGPGNSLYSVWGSGSTDVYAVGESGFILHSTNGGATWTTQSSGTNNSLTRVWGSGSTDVYAAGDFGIILHSANAGATWIALTSGTGGTTLYDLWGSSSTDVYAVGANGVIRHYP